MCEIRCIDAMIPTNASNTFPALPIRNKIVWSWFLLQSLVACIAGLIGDLYDTITHFGSPQLSLIELS